MNSPKISNARQISDFDVSKSLNPVIFTDSIQLLKYELYPFNQGGLLNRTKSKA